jgi:hypothetical protein
VLGLTVLFFFLVVLEKVGVNMSNIVNMVKVFTGVAYMGPNKTSKTVNPEKYSTFDSKINATPVQPIIT